MSILHIYAKILYMCRYTQMYLFIWSEDNLGASISNLLVMIIFGWHDKGWTMFNLITLFSFNYRRLMQELSYYCWYTCIIWCFNNKHLMRLEIFFLFIFFILYFKTSFIRVLFYCQVARRNGLVKSASWCDFHLQGNCFRLGLILVYFYLDKTLKSFYLGLLPWKIEKHLKINNEILVIILQEKKWKA